MLVAVLLPIGLTASDSSLALREYDVLRSLPEGWLESISRNDMPDGQGLAGGNRSMGRWIEAGAQRGSCRAVIAAVVADDLVRADQAWRGIEVAFQHQRGDGGFTAMERPNGGSSSEGAAAVETAYFFLQELGRAILVIRQSPHEAHFRDRIAALEPQLRRACAFIAAGESTILPKSRKAVNRVFIAAKAFGTCGRVLGDEALVATARRLVTEALRQRDADGVFLEHGGRDSSYNAVSLLFAQVLALHVSIPELDVALKTAARWQISRIFISGEVDTRGNTRTGVGKEPGYNGQPKGINYNEVILALALHGTVHRNPSALDAARRVMAWTQRGTATNPWVSGTNRIQLDGRERQVLLDLPTDRKPRAPLLLVFHGFTDSAASIRETAGLTPLAVQQGWVVAYPQGSRDSEGRSFFQVGYDFHRKDKVDDVRAMRELVGRLIRDLDLDPTSICATGFSNGGDFSYFLACQSEPFVTAIAPVGGTMMTSWGGGWHPSAPIHLLAVNMRDDPTTRWEGDPANRDGWGAYLAVEEVWKRWATVQGLNQSRTEELADGVRRRRAWSEEPRCEALFFEIPQGGHRWPKRLGVGQETTADTLVGFFEHLRSRKSP